MASPPLCRGGAAVVGDMLAQDAAEGNSGAALAAHRPFRTRIRMLGCRYGWLGLSARRLR
jgi:hypothetical protein